jgi:drug/metabolite transporter (DMT)-like permease
MAPFQMLRMLCPLPDQGARHAPGVIMRDHWGGRLRLAAVSWGLAGAFAAAVAYGAATVLQAIGARSLGRAAGPDARLMLRLLHSVPYVIGLGLDLVGFALSLAALRSQPLFIVQAIVASSLAVTAILAVLTLHARLVLLEWFALALVTAGLTFLALSANDQAGAKVTFAGRLGLFVGVVVVGSAAAAFARRRMRRGSDAWALGCLAGLMYGAGGVGARVLADPHSLRGLIDDPALWAMAFAGILGLLLFAMALQRGRVTVATATTVVTQTLAPAALGITLLHDRPAHGRTILAAVGFAVTVVGSVLLARYGEAPASGELAT